MTSLGEDDPNKQVIRMTSIGEEDQNKPVINYPTTYQQAHPSHNPSAYPAAQSTDHTNTYIGYPYPAPPVITYRTAYQQAHPSHNPSAYPAAQSTDHTNTYIGYPYTAPPPNPNLYPARSYGFNHALCRLVIFLISALIIFCTLSFITWLILHPQLPEFRVDSATIPPLNNSTSAMPPYWEIGFSVNNTNRKMNIQYEPIVSSLFYGEDQLLCETTLLPFEQEKRTEMLLWSRFNGVDNEKVLDIISDDQKRGMVSLNVALLGWIRFKAGAWKTRYNLMRVICMDVRIGFNSSTGVGNYLGGSSERCKVDFTS
ncbi:Late embryogenesis abundant (LEA) hydroxyproline-rich glycoprotein family [Thalictrum thalictroides]|uniref:Late embryogenesis abundant (LEA) hydroxyproline-rich glycoprotein family n=1 Tax=Thalictrum thalictroides TaxID=46969 RepID=A0A7J6V4B1_THATH|nr:Late embryogenesis abundant (LEA) hydroxyproline-rich glycoprotein family [Thalictrum thalictroides]